MKSLSAFLLLFGDKKIVFKSCLDPCTTMTWSLDSFDLPSYTFMVQNQGKDAQ